MTDRLGWELKPLLGAGTGVRAASPKWSLDFSFATAIGGLRDTGRDDRSQGRASHCGDRACRGRLHALSCRRAGGRGEDRLALQAGQGAEPLRRRPRHHDACRRAASRSGPETRKPRSRRSTASTSIRPSARTRGRTRISRSTPRSARSRSTRPSRYSQHCRVFAPMYRQITLAAILGTEPITEEQAAIAYGDVLAAWKTYLKKENKGRGVVFVGHSQGTVRAPQADRRAGRPEEEGAQAARLGAALRRQRAGRQGRARRRGLPAHPRLHLGR